MVGKLVVVNTETGIVFPARFAVLPYFPPQTRGLENRGAAPINVHAFRAPCHYVNAKWDHGSGLCARARFSRLSAPRENEPTSHFT